MSDKAAQLKAKLQKQKSKDVKKVSVKKKEKPKKSKKIKKPTKTKDSTPVEKKVPKFVPNLSRVEKSGKGEENLRKELKNIIEDNYDETKAFQMFSDQAVDPIAAENPDAEDIGIMIKKSWDDLEPESKKEFALKVLAGKKEQTWGVPGLIQKLLRLPVELQEDFITRYLTQDRGYDIYYESWSESPDVKKRIREYNEKRDESGQLSLGEIESMRDTLRKRAIDYANENVIRIKEEEKSYYNILQHIILEKDRTNLIKKFKIDVDSTEDISNYPGIKDAISKKIQKLHQKLGSDYIDIAAALGAENPLDMQVADLLTYTSKNRKKLIESVTADKANKIRESSHKKLVREAAKIGIRDSSQLSDEVFVIKLLQANVENKPSVNKKDLIEEAHKLGIKDPESYGIIQLKAKVSTLRNQKAKEARKTKVFPSEKDRTILSEKLARITGQSQEYYAQWTIDELQQRYQAMEDGEEFWEEFERETVLDALTKLSNKSRQSYDERETADLVRELEILSEKRAQSANLVAETAYAKKCVAEFRNYKWIDTKVTGVWIAAPKGHSNIREYTTKSYVAVPGRGKFYQANIRFFNLQCNRYAKKRVQEHNVLTCFDNNNHPVQFEVGYSIRGGSKYHKIAWPILVAVDQEGNSIGAIRGNRLLIQNEEIFQAEQDFLAKQLKTINDKKKELLLKPIDETSIAIVKKSLSQTLLRLAPKIKDYELNSPYINIAIDSVVNKDQTNQDLFGIVADTIVFVTLQKAETFRTRIKEEYYLPDMLLKLSLNDKLPEVFDIDNAISDKTANTFASYIRNRVNEIVDEMAESLLPLDPTARKITRSKIFIEPTIDVEYTKNLCVNSNNSILPDNIVYYRDPDDNKVYCLDVEILANEFRQNNFINPHTQKPFDQDFIRRYTVTYFDSQSGESYIFPFSKLYNRLKSGNIINPKTGRVFEKSFIKAISKGSTWRESSALRNKQFNILDKRLTMCRNPKNVEGASFENIVYYKDPDDNGIYCFTIKQLSGMIKQKGAINPFTRKKFSERFVKKFKNIFSTSLHEKGLNQPEFREIYGEEAFKGVALPKKEEEQSMPDLFASEKSALIVPDLWELVSKDFSLVKSDLGVENDTTSEEEDSTSEEEDSTSEEEDSTSEEEKPDEEVEIADKKAEMGFSGKTCTDCKKNCTDECYKSMMIQEGVTKSCQFCSLKCMEKFQFPRFKKNKRGKK